MIDVEKLLEPLAGDSPVGPNDAPSPGREEGPQQDPEFAEVVRCGRRSRFERRGRVGTSGGRGGHHPEHRANDRCGGFRLYRSI
jgi:hypothetical protein